MLLKNTLKRGNNFYQNVLLKAHNELGAIKVFASMIAPVIEAISISIWSKIPDDIKNTQVMYLIYVILGIFVALHLICAIWIVRSENSEPGLLLENHELKKELDKLKRQDKRHNNKTTSLIDSLMAIRLISWGVGYIVSEQRLGVKVNIETLKHVWLSRLLEPIYLRRNGIFQTNGSDLLNMAIYLYNEDSDELETFYRRHDDRIKTRNRAWKPGMGHVGKTFLYRKDLYCKDSEMIKSNADEWDDNDHHQDPIFYRSFASIPIYRLGDNNESSDQKPFGVLVFTSNRPGHFSRAEYELFLWTLSNFLSMFFETAEKMLVDEKLTDGCYVGKTDLENVNDVKKTTKGSKFQYFKTRVGSLFNWK